MRLKIFSSKQPYCNKSKKLAIVLHTTTNWTFLVHSQPESGHMCNRNMEFNSGNYCTIARYDCKCALVGRRLLYNRI